MNSSVIAMIIFKCLAPSYLADDCILVSTVASRRHLHLADTMKMSVQQTRTVISNSLCSICYCHLEQSANGALIDVVHLDICAS